jgi:superfamily II DNA or RNA helicase
MLEKTVSIFLTDEVFCRLSGLTDQHTKLMCDRFALFVDGYVFNHSYKLGRWDGKKRFFHKDGITYIRLLDEIIPTIKKLGYKIKLVDNRTTPIFDAELVNEDTFSYVINPKNGESWKVRPYQVEAVNIAIEAGNGIILAGCVHPDTLVDAQLTCLEGITSRSNIRIAAIRDLLEDDILVQVNSPDGLVDVIEFVDKGQWEEYILTLCDGTMVRCNEDHIFEVVDVGWVSAKQLSSLDKKSLFITSKGCCYGVVTRTGKRIPIVDVTVDHVNHRYYTNGVSSHNTGAGKSSISAILTHRYGEVGARVLTIVPNKSLVRQSHATFQIFKLDAGILYGDEKDLDHTHLVTTWQSLNNQPELVKNFDVVLIDECQGVKSAVLTQILNEAGGHIGYRIGLTGSLPKHETDRTAIKAALGSVIYEIPAHELIADGFLSTAHIQVLVTKDKDAFRRELEKDTDKKIEYSDEMALLRKNSARNNWICDLVSKKAAMPKGNSLVLVGDVKYGKALQKLIPNSVFLHGTDKQKIREQFYSAFDTQNNLIVIATVQIAGVGLSIDRIFHLFFVDIGKSFVRTIQAVGRGLRVGHDKNHVDVYDITSDMAFAASHTRKRMEYYKEANYPVVKTKVDYDSFADFSDTL